MLEDAVSGRSRSLVVRGEAGIGKSALLADLAARADGFRILVTRGVEAEAELAFAGLLSLVRPLLDLLDRLPPPQRAALAGSLGLVAPVPADPFLLGAA